MKMAATRIIAASAESALVLRADRSVDMLSSYPMLISTGISIQDAIATFWTFYPNSASVKRKNAGRGREFDFWRG